MKRCTLLLPLLLATTASAGLRAVQVDALEHAPGDPVAEQLVASAQNARLSGAYADDVFLLAGAAARLDGDYAGDLWVLADNLEFSGAGHDHVRLAGRNVHITGSVSNSLMLAAHSIQVGREARIDGGLHAAGVTLVTEGAVRGGARIVAQKVTLGGAIDGDVRIVADDIVVLPSTRIAGSLRYTSGKELFLDPGVQLGGDLVRVDPVASPSPARSLVWDALWMAATLLAGLPFLLLFPRYAGLSVRTVRGAAWRSALTGVAGFLVVPVVCLLSALTLIGLPLALLLGAFYGVLLYLSRVVIALALGAVLLRQRHELGPGKAILSLAVGLLFLYLAQSLPIVGPGVGLAATMLGTGALMLALFASPSVGAPPPGGTERTNGDAAPSET